MSIASVVICPYCKKFATLVAGSVIYPHRSDLRTKSFYQCAPCGAYVGCHSGTNKPLGRLANAELRKAKMAAHGAFDMLWKDGKMKRTAAYKELASRLGINPQSCHIGMFDVALCKRTVEIAKTIGEVP